MGDSAESPKCFGIQGGRERRRPERRRPHWPGRSGAPQGW